MLRPLIALMAVAMALAAVAVPAGGEDFYRGKTIRLIVPSDVGGGYDLYARTFATHLRRHIPGEPAILVQNMPGGGGLQAANWLFNIAPKDGLVIGLIQRGVPFYPFFGDQNAKFVPDEVQLAWQLHGRNRLDHALAHRQGADDGGRVQGQHRAGRQRPQRQRDLSASDEQHDRNQIPRRVGLSRQLGGLSGDGARRGRGRHRLVVIGEVGAAELGARQAGAGAGAVRAHPRGRSARRSAGHRLREDRRAQDDVERDAGDGGGRPSGHGAAGDSGRS